MSMPVPYKSTPVSDENTLPAWLRREHRTKAGVWGSIRRPLIRHSILRPELPAHRPH